MEIRKSTNFDKWFSSLRDPSTKARIAARIERLSFGLFGDSKSLGGGVSELRLQFGSGWRIYYTLRGKEIVILLVGGDKSTQSEDIETAKALVKEIE